MTGEHRPPRRLAVAATLGGAVAAVVARRRHARRLRSTVQGERPGVLTDDGVLLHVELDGAGSAEAPVVVLVPGFLSSLREYDEQRPVLGRQHKLVLYDQRGHGRSGWGHRRRATLDRLGRDLGQVLDETTGTSSVVIVAHSLGGMTVMALAAQRPDLFGTKVVSVALLSTSAGRLLEGVLPRRAAVVVRRELVHRPLLRMLWAVAPAVEALQPFDTRAGRRWMSRRLFGEDPVPAWAEARMQQLWQGTSQAIAAAFYPAMVHHDGADALPVLRGVPTLVLSGTADATIPMAHSRRIAEELGAGAELVLVEGAGHMVNLTHPDRVNDALLALIAGAPSS